MRRVHRSTRPCRESDRADLAPESKHTGKTTMSAKIVPKRVPVYLYRKSERGAPEPDWGTMTAILALEGCEPITRSARLVKRDALEATGFLPHGVTPDAFDEP
jgi:hypothetical protein